MYSNKEIYALTNIYSIYIYRGCVYRQRDRDNRIYTEIQTETDKARRKESDKKIERKRERER